MSSITQETRRESYEAIQSKVGKRQKQCLEALKKHGECTASELASHLYWEKKIPVANRNYTHPRLNELVGLGLVKVVGTKHDDLSKRNVAVYALAEKGGNA